MGKYRTSRDVPVVRASSKTASELSDFRKAQINSEIENGNAVHEQSFSTSNLMKTASADSSNVQVASFPSVSRGDWRPGDGMSSGAQPVGHANMSSSKLSVGAVAHGKEFNKINKTASTFNGAGSTSGSNVERLAPEVYSPLFTMANLNLPRDRITVNAWIRNFFDLHPIVRNAITLHATYPISKLNLKCQDRKILQFFEDMVEEMGLISSLGEMSLEYWKMGEALSPDSLITMKDGSVKKIQDVEVGDYVLTHTGNFCKVVKVNSREWDGDCYEIMCGGNNMKLTLTGEHPVFSQEVNTLNCSVKAWDRKGLKCFPNRQQNKSCNGVCKGIPQNEFKWIEASKLQKGNIVLRPIVRETNSVDKIGKYSLSKELCKIIGYYAAEGSREENRITFSNTDMEIINDYCKCCDYIGVKYNINKTIEEGFKDCFNVRISDSDFVEFIKNNVFGGYSFDKKFSETIMFLPPEFQKNIIEGFVEGDGWIENTRISLSATSVDLANQFSIMFNRLGVISNLKKRSKIYSREFRGRIISNKHPIYYIQTRVNNTLDYNFLTKNESKFNKFSSKTFTHIQYNDSENGTFSRIEDINKKQYKGLVYDLSVEKDHSYVANGIAVHNCFPFAELDDNTGKWLQIIVHNPDYIIVKKSALSPEPIILMRPDAILQRLVTSNNPADVQLRRRIPEKILYHIKNGQNVPLDNFNISHLKMSSSPYDVRGQSLIVSVFKDLMLYEKLRECKFAQADSMVNPLTLVKIGGNADGEYRATQEDIEFFRQMLEEAQYDKDFKLVTHAGVDITKVGNQGAVMDIAADLDLIIKNIYVGLMVPPAVIDTESATYANASIGLEVLRQRYFNFRAVMAKWLVKKIFAPIAELQEFYEYRNGQKKLIVPEVEWNQMNLYDLQDYISNISGLVSAKQASLQTLYRSLGLNYEEERIRMRQEAIHDAIKRREEEALGKMTLSELRGLDPEKEIMEPIEEKGLEVNELPPEAEAAPGGMSELAPPPVPELGGAPPSGGPGGPGGPPPASPELAGGPAAGPTT